MPRRACYAGKACTTGARRTTSTKKKQRINLNPMKLLNKTVKGLKKVARVGQNISRKTVRSTRSLLKSADRLLAKLEV